MRNIFMAGVAAISLTIMPAVAIAQTSAPGPAAANAVKTTQTTHNAHNKALYDAWPADRKADYDTWTAEQKSFFWGLDTEKRNGYWALSPEQRTQIQGLTPAQQTEAWASISAQLSGKAPTPPPAGAPAMNPDEEMGSVPPAGASVPAGPPPASMMPSSTPASSSRTTTYVTNATVQGGMTAPTPKAEYPVCKGEVKDSCVNRGGK